MWLVLGVICEGVGAFLDVCGLVLAWPFCDVVLHDFVRCWGVFCEDPMHSWHTKGGPREGQELQGEELH